MTLPLDGIRIIAGVVAIARHTSPLDHEASCNIDALATIIIQLRFVYVTYSRNKYSNEG